MKLKQIPMLLSKKRKPLKGAYYMYYADVWNDYVEEVGEREVLIDVKLLTILIMNEHNSCRNGGITNQYLEKEVAEYIATALNQQLKKILKVRDTSTKTQ